MMGRWEESQSGQLEHEMDLIAGEIPKLQRTSKSLH